MTRENFLTTWTMSRTRTSRVATLLALALSSGCGARPTPAASGAGTATATASDEAVPVDDGSALELAMDGCLELLVPGAGAESSCDSTSTCDELLSVEQVQASPARYVCLTRTAEREWVEPEERVGRKSAIETGWYTLAVIERAEGTWAVRAQTTYPYSLGGTFYKQVSITTETIGPGKKTLVVTEDNLRDGESNTEVTFHVVTPGGLDEIFSFASEVWSGGETERSYSIDGKATPGDYHDIVLLVEEQNAEDGGKKSWKERYRWSGKEYEQIESTARD